MLLLVLLAPASVWGTCCADTCRYSSDGDCDDGGAGSEYSACTGGSDCTDCGTRCPSALCVDVCDYASDGDCDDAGPGAEYRSCSLGTDCTDCGHRASGTHYQQLGLTGLCSPLAYLEGTYTLQGTAASGAPYYAHPDGYTLYYDPNAGSCGKSGWFLDSSTVNASRFSDLDSDGA
eukprot:238715-Prymnesium_polylepis.1